MLSTQWDELPRDRLLFISEYAMSKLRVATTVCRVAPELYCISDPPCISRKTGPAAPYSTESARGSESQSFWFSDLPLVSAGGYCSHPNGATIHPLPQDGRTTVAVNQSLRPRIGH
ncbi:hypothetical protein PILCRDRAFT_375493 [Piloderma croceum F 1598]|uniref:Uncharacterized protein n=1 Tax=Piloderma croceum (strain F 1598) TaxID=765440 RepID=A0A0C3FLJ3_PILCF|nr:hypothetical protein PILCRDRAFT_375493 [Piloderma croceum F 1598]